MFKASFKRGVGVEQAALRWVVVKLLDKFQDELLLLYSENQLSSLFECKAGDVVVTTVNEVVISELAFKLKLRISFTDSINEYTAEVTK